MNHIDLYKDPSLINLKEPIVVDFETYYDKDYSLSKITTEEYIRCDKFECIGVSIKVGSQPSKFYREEQGLEIIHNLTKMLPRSPFISHNSTFDMGILGLRYNIHPNFMIDTGIMAKLCGLDRVVGGTSLAKLSAFGVKHGFVRQQKGNTVHNMLGVHRDDMTEQQWDEYADYCCGDSDNAYDLYMDMIDKVPVSELIMADITTKMWTKAVIDLDVPLLKDYAVRLDEERERMLSRISGDLGFPTTEALLKSLRSSKKFVALLESLQVEVPMKWSEKQEKMIPAVSKTDIAFLELLEHENELVRTLVETKLGTMSSMEQTRTATFLAIASRGRMPIPLRYASAHTGRYGGMDKINCFSAGHELLTPDGWVFVEDYQEGTPIMQWHADGTLSFDNNPAWLVKPYQGVMYEVDAPLIACKVTPDHRFSYVRYGKLECGLVTKTIEQVYNSHGMKAIPVKGYVNMPDDDISDDEIRYLVALQADGSVLNTKTCVRHTFGFRRTDKINRMEVLLANLGYEYSKYVSNKTTYYRVAPTGRGATTDKNFGKWLLSLSVRQLTIFCDELLLWDGNKNSNNGSMEYNSTDRNNVLWVDTAMRLCGRHAGIYTYDYGKQVNPNHSTCWRLYERTTTYGAMVTERHIRKVQYDGMVYCPKVDSDMVLVRYGTKIFVTNQCQNLSKRTKDPVLRRSLRAMQGCVWVAADSSQIENRLACFVANQQDVIDVFLAGKDVYIDMATKIYNESYDEIYEQSKGANATKEGKMKRNIAKAVVLGCVGENTEVLTKRGWVAIQDVQDDDLLWDGENWVSHGGVVPMGVKDCYNVNTIYLTADHKVYDGNLWKSFDDLNDGDGTQEYGYWWYATAENWAIANLPSEVVEDWERDGTTGKRWCIPDTDGADFDESWKEACLFEPTQTYDILTVGEHNRFYVRSAYFDVSKPTYLCVHNCGYGASAGKFAELMKQQGLAEQADMADELITTYRTANNMISGFWRECQRVLNVLYAGGSYWFGGANNDLFFADGSSEFYGKKIPSIRLPNGAYIFYQNLRREVGDDGKANYVYDQFKGRNWLPKRIWGSALFENLIQALAFCILKWQAIEIAKTGLSINLNVHDEWASVVPRSKATDAAIIYYQKMKSVPDYIPQGLLDCEVDVGWNYGTLHTIPSKEIEKCL